MDYSEIVAWTYDAGMYCLTCAEGHFGPEIFYPDAHPTDSEGNEAHPVFASDDTSGWYGATCAGCERRIPDDYDWREDPHSVHQELALEEGGTILLAFEPAHESPAGVRFILAATPLDAPHAVHCNGRWFILSMKRADMKHQAEVFRHLADVIEQHLPPKVEVNCGPRPQC